MRVQCNKCHHRFDVPIRAVLTEAARIQNRPAKKTPSPICFRCHRSILPGQPFVGVKNINSGVEFASYHSRVEDCVSAPEANGNVLSPHDLEAKRLRDEAVRRRTNSPKI